MSSKEMKTTKLSSHFLGAVVENGEIMGSGLACIGGHARNATGAILQLLLGASSLGFPENICASMLATFSPRFCCQF